MTEIVIHHGAGQYAPDNSHQALEWALQHKPTRVEVDLFEHNGEVRLAHGLEQFAQADVSLRQAEAMFKNSGIDLMLDLKNYTPALLRQVAGAFQDAAWQDRIIVSSHVSQDARQVARQIPGALASWSLPQVGLTGVNVPVPRDHSDMLQWKQMLPGRISNSLRCRATNLISIQYELWSPELADLCKLYQTGIYLWSAQDAAKLAELQMLEVQGIVSDVIAD